MRRLLPVATALLVACAGASAQAPLRVCLPDDSAPYSFVAAGRPSGFDVDLLDAVSRRIGRALQPVWFESRYDKDGNLSLEARALLAAGACDLVAGMPLYEPHLAPMLADKARTPDYPGAKPLRQRPWQTLLPVAGGAAYRTSAMTLVARDAQLATLSSLDGVQGRAVAVRAGSMASLVLGGWRRGALAASIRGHGAHEDALAALDAGHADFALVDVALWDRYRAAHPDTQLRPTRFDHPLKINIGLLALASDGSLLDAVAAALAAEQSAGRTSALAAANGMTWVAPVTPAVRAVLTLRDFTEAGDAPGQALVSRPATTGTASAPASAVRRRRRPARRSRARGPGA